MIVKKHIANNGMVVAICDKEILGKKFEESNRQLDLTSSFYKGKEMDEESIEKLLHHAVTINAVGKKSVNFLTEKKWTTKENMKKIDGIPHIQIFCSN